MADPAPFRGIVKVGTLIHERTHIRSPCAPDVDPERKVWSLSDPIRATISNNTWLSHAAHPVHPLAPPACLVGLGNDIGEDLSVLLNLSRLESDAVTPPSAVVIHDI